MDCDQPLFSEISSGDGGSDKDGHLTMSDEGGSASEEIYATISRRKKRTIDCTGQDRYLWETTQNDRAVEENTGDNGTELYVYWGSWNVMDRRCKRTKRTRRREEMRREEMRIERDFKLQHFQ